MRRWSSGIALLAVLAIPGVSHAADASAGVDVFSAYLWRGTTFQDTPVVQPWVDISGIPLGRNVSLGINVWSNLPLRDVKEDGALKVDGLEFSEFDPTLTLTLPKGFRVGYVEYTFPTTRSVHALLAEDRIEETFATRELFAGWSGTVVANANVNIDVSYDVDEVDGLYGSIGLGRSFTLRPKLVAAIEGLAGFASRNFSVAYGAGKAGLFDYNLEGKLRFTPRETIAVGLTLGYAGSFDEDVLPEQPVKVYGGVTASLSF